MRILIALAFLLWGITDAHHIPEHSLKEPIFWKGKTSQYDMTLNLTGGVPGMTSQLAKFSIHCRVNIKPKSDTEYLLMLQDVKVSRPESGISSDDEPLSYKKEEGLEAELQKSIRFTLEDGQIKTYSLSKSESSESQKIKRTILRHFEGQFQDQNENDNQEYPYTYSSIKQTSAGEVKSWYVVSVSPYPEFPNEQNVYNVSKTDLYEPIGYPAIHLHHNFAKQGCPEVCKLEPSEESNKYGAGCPLGYEPHHIPVRFYSNGHYNFRKQGSRMILESMSLDESHIASMYDQDMVITISAEYKHVGISSREVPEPRDQTEYRDIEDDVLPKHNQQQDISHEAAYLAELYSFQESELKEHVEKLLAKIAESVVEGKLENPKSQQIGESLILLQRTLSLLKTDHLKQVWSRIIDVRSFKSAGEKEKVKRQIIVDVLPLVGTTDVLEFLKLLIAEQKLTTWETKEVLAALPENILNPNERTIRILDAIRQHSSVENHHILHSTAYLAMARTIRKACVESTFRQKSVPVSSKLFSKYQQDRSSFSGGEPIAENKWKSSQLARDPVASDKLTSCPRELVDRFIKEVAEKLRSTKKMGEKVVYIETLAHMGNKNVLDLLVPYVNASAPELESYPPADVDYVQTGTLYALHHIVAHYPNEVIEYVIPIYLNRTETPRVRIAAFSVLIRCQPSLNVLQHIAVDSWQETSNEVGSYVYSAMTTFGNSSQPCMKLLKKRIQLVISQFKNYDIGTQRAKSIIWTFFDKIRNFGIEKRYTIVPSNESHVPHGIYTALSYNLDSLKETLIQLAINMQGVEPERLLEEIDLAVLGFRLPKDIPSSKENEIFGTANIISRMPKTMRLTIYQKIFYSSSYLYLDAETFRSIMEPWIEHLENIFPRVGSIRKGHLIKVYVPSSLHTFSIGRTAAFPVESIIKHPILLCLKAELESSGSQKEISLKFHPSVYYTEHHSSYVWTPVEKSTCGVYHEQKYSWSMPLEINTRWHKHNQTASFTVKWPDVNRRIFRYHSEAGTYASPARLDRLPSSLNRSPIETIPVMFRKEKVFGIPALPKLYVTAHTEDSTYGYDEIPRTWDETVAFVIKHLRNPGWRRKSINTTLMSNPNSGSQEPGVKFMVNYNMSHETQNKASHSEFSNMGPMIQDEQPRSQDESVESILKPGSELGLQKSDAERLYRKMKQLSHIAHELNVQADSWPSNVHAELKIEYNHTYDKQLHTLSAYAFAIKRGQRDTNKVCVSHVTSYGYSPDEFKYKKGAYDQQRVDFYNEISLESDCDEAFKNPQLVTLGSFRHRPHRALLYADEFEQSVDETWMVPETHEECIDDARKGKEQSIACMKAVREEAIYNNYRIICEWKSGIPPLVRNVTEKLNNAIKYAFYGHADINSLVRNKPSTVELTANYINKLTDTPVLNVYVRTPKETVHYHKVDATYVTPFSSIYDLDEAIVNRLTNNTYPPTCAIMEKYAMTFDHKTFKLPEDQCTYIISTHCTPKKKFSVLARNLKGSKKEIITYVGEHKIVLYPSQGVSYPIDFNGHRYQTDKNSPIILHEEDGIYVHVIPAGQTYNLVLKCAAGLKIIFNGENVKVQVHPVYKGKVCGLCSEFDGEVTREYRGLDQCLYSDSEDFAHSTITDSGRCQVQTTPRFPKLCLHSNNWNPRPETPAENTDEDTKSPSDLRPRLRTIHMQKGEMVCFSTQPAYMCPENTRIQEIERQKLDFHCLPKYDTTTRKLITESNKRILRELAAKSVDFAENISTAKSCSQ